MNDDDVTIGGSGETAFPASASREGSGKEGPGSIIGPYKLVRAIGAGGMGVVYLAEQERPIRRELALKIIKQGMDSEQIIARFEAERQALAMMDHPNIAKVFDANTTETGRPYFVMELVQGVPINQYCDENRLTVRERLELFVPVCQAIQHAHQKGIIHRDIKPSNVLVAIYDSKPSPKVIDFGIAKATGQQMDAETMFTQAGAVVGTLEYMSPEQAMGASSDIDTRSDIYSLGALLYELLTGVTPLAAADLKEAALLEMLRKIREDEPPAPSSRLSQSKQTLLRTSEQRRSDPAKLPKLLHGELDWITMRALEKERARRYETANGFARDIQRYLTGEPVEAGPPSATYRLKKFAGKNRALLGTVTAFAVLLLAGIVVSTWQAVRARRAERVATAERDRANSEAATAKAVTDFLENGLLSQASVAQQSGLDSKPDPDVKVRTLLDRAAATISGKFAGQPAVEADVRGTIGTTYRELSLTAQADEQYQKAYDLDLRTLGPDAPDTLQSIEDLATIKGDEGKLAESTQLHERAVNEMTRVLGPDDRRTVVATQSLGVAYMYQGLYAKAEPLLRKAFENQKRALGMDNIETLDSSDSLETLYIADHKYPEAEELAIKSLPSYRRVYGDNHPYTYRAMFGLGSIYEKEYKLPQAEAAVLPVLEANTRMLGAEHHDTISTMSMVAHIYEKEGRYPEALALQTKVYEASRKQGADLPDTISWESELAAIYADSGNIPKAEFYYKDALERQSRTLGPEHPETLGTMSDLAYLYEIHNRVADAVPMEVRARDIALKEYGPDHREVVAFTTQLGKDYMALGRPKEAEPEFRKALASAVKTVPDNWKRYNLESLLGGALLAEKRYAEAEPLAVSGYEGMKRLEPEMSPPVRAFVKEDHDRLVQLYLAWGKPAKAAEWRNK